MLEWKQVESHQARGPDGQMYQVTESWLPGRRYIAVISFQDRYGRDFSHIIGTFDTIKEAKDACVKDAKDGIDETRVLGRD